MTSSANDNRPGARAPSRARAPAMAPPEFSGSEAEAGRAFDWAEELMARPRRFAPGSRFRAADPLVVALWWAARRHARPEYFLGRDDQLLVDMRPRRDEAGGLYLSGRQLNAFVDHLLDRADGELRGLVYLRPHPDKPSRTLLQVAIDAVARASTDRSET